LEGKLSRSVAVSGVKEKVIVLDREEGVARDEDEREARGRQMAWTAG
jgi:hypothetical protein